MGDRNPHNDMLDSEVYKHITGSTYVGTWHKVLHQMEGVGIYTFRDNSEYRGQFHNGNFHGYGQLKLAPPYDMTFTGYWEKGKLVKVDEMFFADGLKFEADVDVSDSDNPKFVGVSNWKYCSEEDRRFYSEMVGGLPPLSKHSQSTANGIVRALPTGSYDLEEGAYNPVTGCVKPRNPTNSKFYIGCKKDKKWIEANCRYGGSPFEKCEKNDMGIPKHPVCKKIIKSNLSSMAELGIIDGACACNDERFRKRYFHNFCTKNEQDRKSVGDMSSSSSIQSSKILSRASSFDAPLPQENDGDDLASASNSQASIDDVGELEQCEEDLNAKPTQAADEDEDEMAKRKIIQANLGPLPQGSLQLSMRLKGDSQIRIKGVSSGLSGRTNLHMDSDIGLHNEASVIVDRINLQASESVEKTHDN